MKNQSQQLDLQGTPDNVEVTKAPEETAVAAPLPTTGAANMLELAISKGLNVDAIERLVAMCDRERAEQARQAFFVAMADFQAEVPTLEKAKEVRNKAGMLLYKHIPLEEIVPVIQPIAHKHGFSHKFDTNPVEGGVEAVCIVTHVYGHSESTTVFMPYTEGLNTNAAQNRGIIITYAEKGAYRAAYGLQAAKDTDANLPDQPAKIGKEQVDEMAALIVEAEVERADVLKHVGVDALSNMTVDSFAKMRSSLKARVKLNKAAKEIGK